MADKIPGGLSDELTLRDIASHHNVPFEHLKKEAEIGLKVETEHTNDINIAYEIVKDHLYEMPDYYTKLKSIEEIDLMHRKDMPQVDTQNLSKAISMLMKNTKLTKGYVSANKLKISQHELIKDKVKAIANKYNSPSDLKPLIVSKDGHIVDGHHRWGAAVYKFGKDVKIPAYTIGLNGKDAIELYVQIANKINGVSEDIKKVEGGWAVYPKGGGNRLGTHKTKEKALKQLAAIEISKARNEDINEDIKHQASTFEMCMNDMVPLSLPILKQLVETKRVTSFHITDTIGLSKLKSIQGKKKSVSTFTDADGSMGPATGKGMWTDGGVAVLLSGVLLAKSIHDLWSKPDESGRRWITPGNVLYSEFSRNHEVINFGPSQLKDIKKRYKENEEISNEDKNWFIKNYIDTAYKLMLKHKSDFQKTYLSNNGLDYRSDWNEAVVSDIKIEKIYVVHDMINPADFDNIKKTYKNVQLGTSAGLKNFIKSNGGGIREDITIPINIGDTVLGGKFKNKRIIVKSIEKNDKGDITINGKPLLKYRLVAEAVLKELESIREVGDRDWHYIAIKKLWDKAGDFTRKKIAAVVTKNPKSTWEKIAKELKYSDYEEVTHYTDMLRLEGVISENDNLEMLKLLNKAMKAMPQSPKQKEIIKQLNLLRKKNGMAPLSEMSMAESADYKYLTQTILDAKPKYNVYYNSGHNVVNIGGVGYDSGELVKQFNQKPGSSSTIKNNFYYANKDPQTTKREVEKLSKGKIKVDIKKGYGGEPMVVYIVKESVSEMSMADLKKIDQFADKQLDPVDIVLTDKHFFDRLNDPRNGKEISSAELIGFFKRLGKNKKKFLDFLDKYQQIVTTDDKTNINIPMMQQSNKIIGKTIMRKKDFQSSNQKFSI